MTEPIWLDKGIILAIHGKLLARFGGLPGIRDEGLLESAIHRPGQQFEYGDNPAMPELAATYTEGLVKNHPFLDGNKRIGFMAAYTFLGINRHRLTVTEEEAVIMTRGLAAGEVEAAAYARWLENGTAAGA